MAGSRLQYNFLFIFVVKITTLTAQITDQ